MRERNYYSSKWKLLILCMCMKEKIYLDRKYYIWRNMWKYNLLMRNDNDMKTEEKRRRENEEKVMS